MKKVISILTIVCLILGIIGGIFVPTFMEDIDFIGIIYVNLLKFMIIPIIFSSIIVTVYNSNKLKGKLIFKTVLLFLVMFVLTFLLSSLIIFIIRPGINYKFDEIPWDGVVNTLRWQDVVINLFPTNIISIIENNNIFASIIVAFVFGICATKVKNGKVFIEFFESLRDILFKVLEFIMYLTPLAVLSLIGNMVASYGSVILGLGLKYIILAYVISIIVLMVIMILPVMIICHINPITYIKKVSKVWIISLTTCSSAATLPTTIKVCNEEFGISNKITSMVVPLGTTIHMCGGAVSFALLGIFTSEVYGIDLTFGLFLQMLIFSTLINMAAPGIPNGGIVIGASYLSLLGIPLTFMGFYSGIYKLLDMVYTTLNVTGDITASILIEKITHTWEKK